MISLSKLAPKGSAEVLSSVLRAVMCLVEEIHLSDKRYSDMSYRAIGHKFNVNESTTYTE